MYPNVFQCFIIVAFASSILLAQDTNKPEQRSASSETEVASSSITLPIRPTGKYGFLSRPASPLDLGKFGPTMPFTWIEAEWKEVGNTLRGEPHVHHRIRLNRDRSASYVTASVVGGERKDHIKDHVYRQGEIDERDYAKICLLLEQFDVGKRTCNLGRLTPTDNVFANLSSLRVHVAASDSIQTYRNDDGGVGDYRYWLIQTVIKQQTSEDIWWKVPPPNDASEQTDEPEPE
jgi:hypothetical protein